MARTRNNEAFAAAREDLLAVGERLIRSGSYDGVGINDILKASGVPKGSFYHYFESKEAYGLEVARFYHAQQMETARRTLRGDKPGPQERLHRFFSEALKDFAARDFADGCLMCNLSSELADGNGPFQALLKTQWRELSGEIAACLAQFDRAEIGLAHLTAQEAADWLLNAWSGALTRMKAERNAKPLRLFLKSIFRQGKPT